MHFCLQVATVDSFQGAEKDVIILSTVRTGQRGLSGFLTSERRVNVAVTRARHHLVLVGHVGTLQQSIMWRRLIGEADGVCRYTGDCDPVAWKRQWQRRSHQQQLLQPVQQQHLHQHKHQPQHREQQQQQMQQPQQQQQQHWHQCENKHHQYVRTQQHESQQHVCRCSSTSRRR